jgi:hypothetical protein
VVSAAEVSLTEHIACNTVSLLRRRGYQLERTIPVDSEVAGHI